MKLRIEAHSENMLTENIALRKLLCSCILDGKYKNGGGEDGDDDDDVSYNADLSDVFYYTDIGDNVDKI
jgi:hypothetical protein